MFKKTLYFTLLLISFNYALANSYLMLIGGHLEPDNKLIWNKIKSIGKISTSKSKAPMACIWVTNTGEPDESAKYYADIFKEYGLQSKVVPIYYDSEIKPGWKDNQNRESTAKLIRSCNIYFFTGGDQSRTTNILFNDDGSESLALKTLRQELDKSKLLAGTSAGDMMQSNPMITGGNYNKKTGQNTVKLDKGLGFFEPKNLIVDSHFSQRNRLPRLIKAMEIAHINTGIGVDEETALFIEVNINGKSISDWEIIGNNEVIIVHFLDNLDKDIIIKHLHNGQYYHK
ncbi:cyanophycinase [Francisellaceae bacterium]|nr:cyanophycinase [Francisellaceae bacterium]